MRRTKSKKSSLVSSDVDYFCGNDLENEEYISVIYSLRIIKDCAQKTLIELTLSSSIK